ncbi:hypothetical protein EBR43_01050 [bacterium]|jgi:hypothetical protein|nr:hypothetical protein [bacterium]NBX72012.1 hypothetical protein [bacterium]
MNRRLPTDALAEGLIVVVPNNRAQQFWVEAYCKSRASCAPILPASRVLSFTDFIRQVFKLQKDFFDATLLQDLQVSLGLLNLLPVTIPLNELPHYVHLFLQAFKVMIRWRISIKEFKKYTLNDQQYFFAEKSVLFKQWLAEHRLFVIEQAIEALIEQDQIQWPAQSYFFYGFDDYYPLQEALFQRMQQDGLYLEFEQHHHNESFHHKKYNFFQKEEEIKEAIKWLTNLPHDEPGVIVVLEMNKEFKYLVDKVIHTLEPELMRLPLEQVLKNIAFSSGVPLSEQALVSELLTLLQSLRFQQTFFLSAHHFLAQINYVAHSQRTLYSWNQLLLKALESAQWCQQVQLTSVEYQAHVMFLEKLDQLNQVSVFLEEYNYQEWVTYLTVYFKSVIFQPQSLESHRYCMGLLEAAPLGFEHVWVIGADASQIPQSLNPHPLLPADMQEVHWMPHAHYQREHHYLTKILSRLAQAQDFCLSYAKQDHYRHYYPSPMLEQIFPGPYQPMRSEIKNHTLYAWTYLPQDDYQPIAPQRITVAQLNHFLQCPFKGFVRTLTGAQAPIKTLLPIDPAGHGRLIHQYLQDRLACKNEDHALALYTAHWSPLLREVEKNRLDALYHQVKEVFDGHQEHLSFEYKVSFEMDNWCIEGRVDIWDFDKKHVYDLKSKNFIASSWFSQDPTDCQGPLYALGLNAHSLGVIRLTQPDIVMNCEKVQPYYTHWSCQLKALLLRWSTGNFDPKPQHIGICHHCSLKKACRYETF